MNSRKFYYIWICLLCLFPALVTAQTLTHYEYWFDDGFDNRITMGLSGTEKDVTAGLDTRSLGNGLHQFFLRLKQSDGMYSPITSQYFFKAQVEDRGALEYWFDDNRSGCKRIASHLASDGKAYVVNTTIDVNHLSAGYHRLYYRFVNEDGSVCSATSMTPVVIKGNYFQASDYATVTKYRVSVDGKNAQEKAVEAPANVVEIEHSFNASALNEGTHRITTTFWNSEGYSVTDQSTFKVGAGRRLATPDPATFKATDFTETGFTASWDAVPGALRYDILVKKEKGGDYANADYNGGSTEPSVKVYGLEPGTSYLFQVRAKTDNWDERSEWSPSIPTAVRTIDSGAIPAPLGIQSYTGIDGTKSLTVGLPHLYQVWVKNIGTTPWEGSFYLKEGDEDIKGWHKVLLAEGTSQRFECYYTPKTTGEHKLTLYYQTGGKGDGSQVKHNEVVNPLDILVREAILPVEETSSIRLVDNLVYPASITMGETGVIEAKVKNFSDKDWSGTLHLSLNGQQPFKTEKIKSLKPNEDYTLTYIWSPERPGKYKLILYQKEGDETASYVGSNGFEHPVDVTIINPNPIKKVKVKGITTSLTPETVPSGAEVYYHLRVTDIFDNPVPDMKIVFNRKIQKADGTIEERPSIETDYSDENGVISFAIVSDRFFSVASPLVYSGETIELTVNEVISKYNVGVPLDNSPSPIKLTVKEQGFLSDFDQFKLSFEPGVSFTGGLSAGGSEILSFDAGLHIPFAISLKKGDSGKIKSFSVDMGARANIEAAANAFDWFEAKGGAEVGCNNTFTYELEDRLDCIDAIVRGCEVLANDDDAKAQEGSKVLGSWWNKKIRQAVDIGSRFYPSSDYYISISTEAGFGVSKKFPDKMSNLLKSLNLPSSFDMGNLEINSKAVFKWEPYKRKRDSENRDIWGAGCNLNLQCNTLLLPAWQSVWFVGKSWWQSANVDQYCQQLLESDIITSFVANTKNKGSISIREESFFKEEDMRTMCEISNKLEMTSTRSVDISDLGIVKKFQAEADKKPKAKASLSSTLSSKLTSKGDFAEFLHNTERYNRDIAKKIYPALDGSSIIGAPKAHYNILKEDHLKELSRLMTSNLKSTSLNNDLKMEMQVKSKAGAEVRIPIEAGFILNFNVDLKLELECECYPSQSYYSLEDKRFYPVVLQPAFTITGAVKGLTQRLAEKLGLSFEDDDKREIDEEYQNLTQYGAGYVVAEPVYISTPNTHLSMENSNYYYQLARRRHPRLVEKKQSDISSLTFAINENANNFAKGTKITSHSFYHAGDLFGRTEWGDTLFVVSEVFDIAAVQGTDTLKTTQAGKMKLETYVGVDDLTPFGFSDSTPLDVYQADEGSNIWHYVGPACTTLLVDKLGSYMMATSIKNDLVAPEIRAELNRNTGALHLHVSDNIAIKTRTLMVQVNGEIREVSMINEQNFEVQLSEEEFNYMITLYVTVNDLAGNQGNLFQTFFIDKSDNIDIVKENEDQTMVRLSKDLLKVEGAQPDVRIMLFALNGTIMAQGQTDAYGRAQLHLNHLTSGVYIVTLSNGKSKKFVIK